MTNIKYVKGDLTKATEQLIVHGCNAQGVMRSGVAKALREKWPQIFKVYRQKYDDDFYWGIDSSDGGMGTYTSCSVGPNTTILNAITQNRYGKDGRKYVSYDALDKVLRRIADDYLGVPAIAMPKIGSGLGGGDWDIIEKIIEKTIAQTMQVVVYEI